MRFLRRRPPPRARHDGNTEPERDEEATPPPVADRAAAIADPPAPTPPSPPVPPAPAATSLVTTRLELPTRTIAKVILTLAILWLLGQLWTMLLLLFIALLLASALDPVVARLHRRGWPRPLSVALIVVALLGSGALVLWILVPPVVEQAVAFADDVPTYVDDVQRLLRTNQDVVDRLREATGGASGNAGAVVTRFLAAGANLVQGVANLFILFVLTLYLLLDGERVTDWVLGYLPPRQTAKVRRSLPEISRVVSGYVVGQAINSTLFGLFAFVVLAVVGVPQPLLLAVLAALMDAIPIAGVLIATVPAVLLAATVSWPAAGIVLALYLAYQQIENYLIVPRVFRGTLQISSFAVIVAVLVGGQLLGVVGVVLALPIAAAIPVIARIWTEDEDPPGEPA